MNDTILRGICENCDMPWTFEQFEKMKEINYTPCLTRVGKQCQILWSLFQKQILILSKSPRYRSWYNSIMCNATNEYEALAECLRENPFFINEILKESVPQ